MVGNPPNRAIANGEALVGREDNEAEGGDRDHGRAEVRAGRVAIALELQGASCRCCA